MCRHTFGCWKGVIPANATPAGRVTKCVGADIPVVFTWEYGQSNTPTANAPVYGRAIIIIVAIFVVIRCPAGGVDRTHARKTGISGVVVSVGIAGSIDEAMVLAKGIITPARPITKIPGACRAIRAAIDFADALFVDAVVSVGAGVSIVT